MAFYRFHTYLKDQISVTPFHEIFIELKIAGFFWMFHNCWLPETRTERLDYTASAGFQSGIDRAVNQSSWTRP